VQLGSGQGSTSDIQGTIGGRLVERSTRRRVLGGIGAVGAALWAGSRAHAQTPDASPESGWSFTDDRNLTITLPEQPVRVVSDMMIATALWDLGYRVAGVWGSASYMANPKWSELSSYDGEGIEEVTGNTGWTPDIEKVASIGPDLIAGITYFGDEFYFIEEGDQERLDHLAPTVGLSNGGVSIASLQARVEALAISLGADVTQAEVVARKERYATAADKLRAAAAAKPELKVLFFYGAADQIYVANENAWGDLRLFAELGVNIVPTVEGDEADYYWDTVSWELISNYPADLILVGNDAADTAYADNALWKTLPAVQAGQVGVWGTNAPPSYQSTAYLLESLTAAIDQANVIV
jgi:iron complex transport system substrate-binding protein